MYQMWERRYRCGAHERAAVIERARKHCPGYGEGGHSAYLHEFYPGSRRCKACDREYHKRLRALNKQRENNLLNPIILTGSAFWLTKPL